MNLNIKPKEKLKKEKQKLHIKHNTYNKGITLIALIITIVILLILAVVTISAVQGDGIIGYAKKAKSEWEKASEEEQNELIDLEVDVAGGPWKVEGDKVINIKTKDELSVGDYVNYSATPADGKSLEYTSSTAKTGATADQKFEVKSGTDIKWRVLDVQNGKIRLISETFVEPTEGGQEYSGEEKKNGEPTTKNGHKYYTLKGQTGFINGIDELNNICAIYGHGKGAESATSITVDDVNKITGYDPITAKYDEGNIGEYGNVVTYTKGSDGNVTLKSTNKAEEKNSTTEKDKNITTFKYYDKSTRSFKDLNQGESISIISTYYKYYPTTLRYDKVQATYGVDNNKNYNKVYEMLFGKYSVSESNDGTLEYKGEDSSPNYWTASVGANTPLTGAQWGIFWVHDGFVSRSWLCSAIGSNNGWSCGVRPVVTLKSDIELNKTSNTESAGAGGVNVDTWSING